jgi:hypothetical protein
VIKTKNSGRVFILSITIIILAWAASFAADYVLTGDGGYCWFADPRAVYYKGTNERTYIGWITSSGAVTVAQYDHASQQTTTTVLQYNFEADDHDNPSLLVRASDKRIMVFYSKHTVEPHLYFRISTNPEDISSFGTEREVSGIVDDVTYPTPFQLSAESNRIYLFWRGIGWQPTFTTSNDGGATWAAPLQLVQGTDRPYIKFESDGASRIHFAFTEGHPRMNASNHIYYAYLYNGGFYRANGTFIKNVSSGYLTTSEAEMVYNASAGKGWVWEIALDSLGRPVIAYVAFPTDTDHRYRYARWTGSSWNDHQIIAAGQWFPQTPAATTEPEPNYSGGIALDPENPSIVYLSRSINNIFEIEKWTTSDNGTTWPSTVSITSNSACLNVRPFVVKNHIQNGFELLWLTGDYVHYTNYHTAIKTTFVLDTPLATMNLNFDMGTDALPASGYTRVKARTRFFTGSFGWTDTSGNFSRLRTGPTLPNADMVSNSAARTFKVDLRNGNYTIGVVMGDQSYAHDIMSLTANGTVLASGITTAAGSYYTNSFTVAITGGALSFSIADNGGSDANWVLNALTIQSQTASLRRNPSAVHRCSQAMTCTWIGIQNETRISLFMPNGHSSIIVPVRIYDFNGRLLRSTAVINGVIDFRNAGSVPAGVYIVRTNEVHQ